MKGLVRAHSIIGMRHNGPSPRRHLYSGGEIGSPRSHSKWLEVLGAKGAARKRRERLVRFSRRTGV